ncbi:alpha/beta fold hydrolase [Anthocerotibacter panamensis]|uniref:alpha/beta fold hydrolase n=1 Tax=Anthocerotibacter panamensis TaxID=2857077 RepID=UPI001C402546|nr:alpha/beta fold hydrolase [Anthocerotibacter panamensis]
MYLRTCPSTASTFPVSHFWTWRGYPIHYVESGLAHQGTPLLLIHGCGASTEHWRKNIAVLAASHPVYAIDLLGFGRSAKPELVYSGDLWRDQLRDFCAYVVKAPVIVVGNSLGGYASLVLAADCPEWTAGVALLNSAGFFAEDRPVGTWRTWFADQGRRMCAHHWVNWWLFQCFRRPSMIRKVLLKVYRDPSAVTEQLIESIYRPSCDPGAAKVFRALLKAPQRFVDELLTQLSRPLLLLWGEWDPCLTLQEARKFLRCYPKAQLKTIPAGHCPQDEQPEMVNRYLLEWSLEVERVNLPSHTP